MKLKRSSYPGKLIVFEGTDGAGKTTLINKTKEYLYAKIGYGNILSVKQPTDLSRKTKLFQKMMYCENHGEIDYRAVQLLTMSDRIQHQHEVIIPALQAGKVVVCDRYIYTSVANMEARGYCDETWFYDVAENIIEPDLCFLAYVEPDIAISRIKMRPEEVRRYLNEELLRDVAKYFFDNACNYGMQIIETNRDADSAFEEMRIALDRLFGGEI